jgi:pimeloyl-ACP methyl ester carboxylesterase
VLRCARPADVELGVDDDWQPITVGDLHAHAAVLRVDIDEATRPLDAVIGQLPETVIANSLDLFVGRGDETLGAEYLRVFRIPGTLHAMCEDYRAGASIDFEHDGADLDKKVQCPLLVLWGERGSVNARYDALAIWGERATRLTGKLMPGGHSFQESHPAETVAELRAFLSGGNA